MIRRGFGYASLILLTVAFAMIAFAGIGVVGTTHDAGVPAMTAQRVTGASSLTQSSSIKVAVYNVDHSPQSNVKDRFAMVAQRSIGLTNGEPLDALGVKLQTHQRRNRFVKNMKFAFA